MTVVVAMVKSDSGGNSGEFGSDGGFNIFK